MREIVLQVRRDAVEPWCDALLEAGALAVQAEDADADSPDEQPLYGEPGHEPAALAWDRTVLAAMVGDEVDDAAAARLLADAADAIGVPAPAADDWRMRALPDQDWVRATQAQFEPIEVGTRLLIAPSWHPQPGSARRAIEMDPGLAFGTGSHPTTRLCLEWLDAQVAGGERVIDYGCGSGILAIAALRLGAAEVVAIDIDPQALAATRENARRNAVSLTVRAADDPTSAPLAPVDIVVANILSNPLKLLAPMLSSLVAPGGALVLSGVLERQADEVAAAYAPWLRLSVAGVREGWVCLAARREAAA